jgi:hypothetical protein
MVSGTNCHPCLGPLKPLRSRQVAPSQLNLKIGSYASLCCAEALNLHKHLSSFG